MSRRTGSTCAASRQTPTSAPSSPAFARSGSQTTDRDCVACSRPRGRAPDRRRSDRSARVRSRCRRARASCAASARLPRRKLGRGAELAPGHDLALGHGQHLRERRRAERRDVERLAEAAEVDEQPRERGEIESAARPRRPRRVARARERAAAEPRQRRRGAAAPTRRSARRRSCDPSAAERRAPRRRPGARRRSPGRR